MRKIAVLFFFWGVCAFANQNFDPRSGYRNWYEDPRFQDSLTVEPITEEVVASDGLVLRFKRFVRKEARPIILIPGLSQNDRFWDAGVRKFSCARFLHAMGFDVWVANLRGGGTPGFRSDAPPNEKLLSLTSEDYSILDLPSFVDKVRRETNRAPWLIGHSLGNWAIEGYLGGLHYDISANAVPDWELSTKRQSNLAGVVYVGGPHNMWWDHALKNAKEHPISTLDEYYRSNYELEMFSESKLLTWILGLSPKLSVFWVRKLMTLPLNQIPWIGGHLDKLYQGALHKLVLSGVGSAFYYASNTDPEVVRLHGVDGQEDFLPRLLEQIANTVRDKKALAYYHENPSPGIFEYQWVRGHLTLPVLFVAGGRDRLASATMIYEDGYLATRSEKKKYLLANENGHMDLVSGKNAATGVLLPMVEWMRSQ